MDMIHDPIGRVLQRLKGVRQTSAGWDALCPAHDDRWPSLGIATGGDGRVLLRCRSQGCSVESIVAAIGLTMRDLFPANGRADGTAKFGSIVATYQYHDDAGIVLYEVVRYNPKDFRQRRPDGKGGWTWKLGDVPRVPYRLRELLAADPAAFVFVCEGEKDCDNLAKVGLVATCNPGGAGKWNNLDKATVKRAFATRRVVIVPDNDQPGRQHAEAVAANLRPIAAQIKVAHLDGLPNKGDVSDWLAAGGTAEQLLTLAAAPQARPTAPAPYRPFPVIVLPSPLREYVQQAALALGCDPAYVALPCLAVAAGLIGYTRALRPKRTWRIYAVLWTLVVADSGSLKTPAWRLATDYLFTLQKRLDLEFKRKLAEYLIEKEKWDAAVKAAKDEEGDPPGDEPEPPVRPSVFTSDATIEAIAELIGENPRGIIVSCDELAGWFGSFARYKGKAGGTDLPRWLSMHSAGGFAYHRKTGDRRRIIVPHAAVSIAGGIQPGILARAFASGEFAEAGLASRLLMAMPPRPPKVWTDLEIDPDTEKRYHDLLDALYALQFDRWEGEDVPHVLKLSPHAKTVWVEWYTAWGREQAAVEGELAAAFSKLEEAAGRFALLHHVVSRLGRGEADLCDVQPESMAAGITLARWFAAEAERIYAALAEDEGERDCRRLIEFLRTRDGRITVRELQRSNGRKYPDAKAAEAALEALVRAGLAQWTDPEGAKGGRVCELCPTPDTSDTCDAGTEADAEGTSHSSPDINCESPEFQAKNGQVSDVSDCRTDSAAASDGAEPGAGSAGLDVEVSGAAGGSWTAPDLDAGERATIDWLDAEDGPYGPGRGRR